MKRILSVAIVATLLAASCSKTDIINPVGNQIGFTTKMAKLTKASGDPADAESTGLANLQAQDFRIWAYADYDDPYTSTSELNQIYDGMAGLNVAYNKADDSWAPELDYYWPGKNKALRFFAVSGEGNHKVDVAITQTTGEGEAAVTTVAPTVTIADYVVNNANPNTDLMVADFVHQKQDDEVNGVKGNVALNFRHALTKVQFLFKTNLTTDDGNVYVQSVSVEGLNTKSTLVVDGEGETLADKFVWGERLVPATFNDDYTKTGGDGFPTSLLHINETVAKEPTDKTAMLLDGGAEPFCTWLALPQNVEAKKVKIVYVIGNRQFERSFELSKGDLKNWGVNQYVRYTVTLTPNKIAFDSSVEDWSTTDVAEKEL